MILPTIDDMRREALRGSRTIPAVAFSVPFELLTVLNKTFLEPFDVDRLNILIIVERLSGSDTGTLADNHVLRFQAGGAVGDVAGRPKTSPKDAKVRLAKTLLADKSLEVDDICETLKISRSTLYRYANL